MHRENSHALLVLFLGTALLAVVLTISFSLADHFGVLYALLGAPLLANAAVALLFMSNLLNGADRSELTRTRPLPHSANSSHAAVPRCPD
jgi:hypothetical protein